MAIEFALEKFPVKCALRDGVPVSVRPLERRDSAKLIRFFSAVPEEDRLMIEDRVVDRAVVNRWCRQSDAEARFTLLMLTGTKVIGLASLQQRPGGWKRHIGILTTLTHPDFRGRDVVRVLVEEILDVARHLGLHRLEAELNHRRSTAIRALESAGFRQLLRLTDYVMDMQGTAQDYVLLGTELQTDEEFAATG